MASPKMMREVGVFSRLETIVRAFLKRGAFVIKHTDGDNGPILKDLADTGIDALHPVQPDVMDIGQVKRDYGDRLCLWGNISCSTTLQWGSTADVRGEVIGCIEAAAYSGGAQSTLAFSTAEEVRRKVRDRMGTVGKGGGLLIAPAHSVESLTPSENVVALFRAVDEYGNY